MFVLVLYWDGQTFHSALTCNSTGQSPLSSPTTNFTLEANSLSCPKGPEFAATLLQGSDMTSLPVFPFWAQRPAGSAHRYTQAVGLHTGSAEHETEIARMKQNPFSTGVEWRVRAKRRGRWLVMLPEGSWSLTIPPAGKDDVLPEALQGPLCAPCCRITKPGPHSLLASPLHFQGTRSSGCHPLSRTSPGTEPPQYLLLPRFSPLGSSSTGLRLMGCEGRLPHASLSASASSPCPVSRRIERNTGKACCPRLSRSMTSCRTCSLRVRRLCGGRKKQDEAQRHPTSHPPLQSPFR